VIDILVPVLGRPANAAPLVESIVEHTRSPYRIIFICSPEDHDEILACNATEAEVVIAPFESGPGDFARKINWAFEHTLSEWVFQGADDIRFSARWDLEALKVARMRKCAVIGTNDLHNPAVKQGRHSTHTLFSRAYIDSHGSGTYDNTGLVFCELYDHQFVDTEFCETAMIRKEWAFARRAVVEHLHPYWGKVAFDDTYTKALRATQADLDLYRQRSPGYIHRRR
jgi:glycosyltransferase involved in cell wall biosynthesis